MKIIYGKEIAKKIVLTTENMYKTFKNSSNLLRKPRLLLLRTSNNKDVLSYEFSIIKKMNELDVKVLSHYYPIGDNLSEYSIETALKEITHLFYESSIDAVLLLKPFNNELLELIGKSIPNSIIHFKDVDKTIVPFLNNFNLTKNEHNMPCTAQAVFSIIDHQGINLKGKKVLVIGRSNVVGKPVALMALNRDATVTICHSKTENLSLELQTADVIISSAGVSNLINAKDIKDGCFIIDVSINVDNLGKLCGDVDIDSFNEKHCYITPVPGGVGVVTNAILYKEVIKAYIENNTIN